MSNKAKKLSIQRDILRLLRNNGHRAYRAKEMAKKLGYRANDTYRLFRDVLDELTATNRINQVKGGRYAHKKRPRVLNEGLLRVNRMGYGFVELEGEEEDIYIPAVRMGTALDGDRVRIGLAARARDDRRVEGEVLEVLERRRKETVGTFQDAGHIGVVHPDDTRLTHNVYVAPEHFNGATPGDKVRVSIDAFDDPHGAPKGRILETLGRADDPAVQVLALAQSMDVKVRFPEPVEQEAARIPDVIPPEALTGRLDLRDKRIFTIDPEDAKDFDDAIHIEPLSNGLYEIGVHIADVSYYVRPAAALDREAFNRGTSVYLVDRVIPMLPEKLSNRVCSLRPGEDKLTYSCLMKITPEGQIRDYEIRETVIHSKHRFTYEEAQVLLDDPNARHPLADDVRRAGHLASTLTAYRMTHGSINFNLPEVRVRLDEHGFPAAIVRKEQKAANRLIEEFMLLANRTVTHAIARDHAKAREGTPLPYVFRVHDRPDPEKIQHLAAYVRTFGHTLDLDEGNVSSRKLNELILAIQDTPEELVITRAALQAMAKAKYTTQNIGHFGLGFDYYTHFTSPIRRYPDLMVHRLMKRYLGAGKGPQGSDEEARSELESRCEHCSAQERAAEEAERESVKLKQVQYIQQHVGEVFPGIVSGVTKFGFFVELEGVLVEGLVHVRDLDDDYYEYDERTYRLVGLNSGRTFRPGDTVEVIVAQASVETREVDLILARRTHGRG